MKYLISLITAIAMMAGIFRMIEMIGSAIENLGR